MREVIENYRKNRDEAFLKASKEAGVFNSLYELEKEGTQLDKILNEMRFNIMNAEFVKVNAELVKKLNETYSTRVKHNGIKVKLGDEGLTSLERARRHFENNELVIAPYPEKFAYRHFENNELVIAPHSEKFVYLNQSGEKLVPQSSIWKLFSNSYKK